MDQTRQQFLTGVFIGPDEPSGDPPDVGAPPAPPSLHFTDETPTPDGYYSHDFSTLSPQLGQVFFIGDAKTSTGMLQKFQVPQGATRLYLGMADAYAFHGLPGSYDDNCGEYTITGQNVQVEPLDPITSIQLQPATTDASTGTEAHFTGTAKASDGSLLAGVVVTATVTGANPSTITAVTDTSGVARFTYRGASSGVDTIQAAAAITAAPTVSNTATVTWTPGTGSGTGGGGQGLPGPKLGGCDPADGAQVSAPTTLTCTLSPTSGTTVDSWSVTTAPVGAPGSESQTLGSGSGTNVSVPLDPTKLANGQWTITISATGSDGGTSSSTEVVVVDGRLKLGRLRVSYQDMSVPVAGVPMTVTRTYDTLDRLHRGDFGQGWSLGLANFRVQTGRALGTGGWSQRSCGSAFVAPIDCVESSASHVVTVTWPDGHTESFKFAPEPAPPAFTFMNQAAYTPIDGATSTLSPAPGDQFSMYAGTDDLFVPLSDQVYDPQRFVLTAKDGTKYLLDRTSGLVSATTVDGNTITVDADGVTSSQGPSISFVRNAEGRITKVTGPDGRTRGYSYDADGDLTTYVNGRGDIQKFSYAPGHYLTGVPGGGKEMSQTFAFGSDGRVSSITDGDGHVTQVGFDLDGRTRTVTSPSGVLTVTHFTVLGDPDTQTVIAGGQSAVTSWTRDAQGRVLSVTDPDGAVTTNTWDDKGNKTSTTDPDGVKTGTSFNKFSESVDTTVDGVTAERRGYDDLGRLVSKGRPGQAGTSYGWSGSKVTSITDPSGAVTSIGYDADGFVSTIASPAGTVTRLNDPAGRVIGMVSPAGVHTGMEYDADGNLIGLVGDDNVSQSWSYDRAGDVTAATDKLGRTSTYTYDDSDHLVSAKDRDSHVTTYSYTLDGKIASQTSPDGVTSYGYDGFGRPTTIANPKATVSFVWSPGGKLQSESTDYAMAGVPDQTVNYTTSAAGRVSSITGQGSTTGYGYDSQGRPASVTDTVAGTFGFAYDPATGSLASMTRPNGISDRYSFDADGRLTGRDAKDASGTIIDQADYTYNPAGLRDSLTDLAGVHAYSYDTDGRLTGVDNPAGGQPDEAFSYDSLGNMTSWPANPASQVLHNQADQLTRDATNTYGYDNEGNRIWAQDRTTHKSTNYTWDTAHHLTKIKHPDGTTDSYTYGPLGRRLTDTNSTTGTRAFVWAGANLRATLDGSGNLISRNISTAQLNGTLAVTTGDGTNIYPLKDGLGSTTATTNNTGTVTSTTSYTAYGTPTTTGNDAGVGQVAGYTGHQSDPGGLIYARARYYNPTNGTFLTQDPFPASDLYSYASGDPINHTDPDGRLTVGEGMLLGAMFGAISGGIGGAVSGAVGCHGDESCMLREVLLNMLLGAGTGAAFGAGLPALAVTGASAALVSCALNASYGSMAGIGIDSLSGSRASGGMSALLLGFGMVLGCVPTP